MKVADFGLARIKEENVTMTRCGTPCWTAPEILGGKKYDERVDVYSCVLPMVLPMATNDGPNLFVVWFSLACSFGVIMWQVVTRKQPFAGLNFMNVTLDVLEGRRPSIPQDCPRPFKKMIKKCWHTDPEERPTIEEVINFFERMEENGDLLDSLA